MTSINGNDTVISSGKDLSPYWSASCAERSNNWMSLTETGCVGSDLNSLSPLQIATTSNSWFSARHNSHLRTDLHETLFPSSMFSVVAFTDSEDKVPRSRKIRIYPDKDSIPLFRRYLGLSRHWYNKTVAYLKDGTVTANFYAVRKSVGLSFEHEWEMDCPQRIRQYAISDAVEAAKNLKKKAWTTGKRGDIHFRSKRELRQSFAFDAESLKENKIFGYKKRKILFSSTEPIGSKHSEGCRVLLENRKWYLIAPQYVTVRKPETQRLPLVSIDPGVRNFVAYFSPECSGTIGGGDFGRIARLCFYLDDLYGRMSKAKCRQKKRMRLAVARMRTKIRNLVDDMHRKAAHFFVTRFDRIILPPFETSKMVTTLRSKTARSMMTWAHYRFAQTLEAMAERYGATVERVSEAYTSRTCSYCGTVHPKNSRKEMVCACGASVGRDANGARGIMLRALGASPFDSKELMHLLPIG